MAKLTIIPSAPLLPALPAPSVAAVAVVAVAFASSDALRRSEEALAPVALALVLVLVLVLVLLVVVVFVGDLGEGMPRRSSAHRGAPAPIDSCETATRPWSGETRAAQSEAAPPRVTPAVTPLDSLMK
jgi:hypothetical protein